MSNVSSPLKQSLCLPSLQLCGADPFEMIRVAAKCGYEAIDLWAREENFEDLVAEAKDLGLVVASMVGHWTHEEGLNDPSNHPRIHDELAESIDIAHRHQIPGVITLSGNRREGVGDQEAAEITVEGLQPMLSLAEEKGIDLNLELLNSKVDHPKYQADHTAWGVQVCELADHPRCKLLYDIYHMQIMEGDVIRTLTDHIAHIGHFHTAGVPGRHDLDDSQELNYRAIAKSIAATNYDGYVAHEFWPKADPAEAARQAFRACSW